jgi:hypothetical protein
MIISHKHKYLFVELPLTGSTAISRELCQYYDGSKILFKHATYYDFLRYANTEEKTYFVFSCIRNPLDQAVSHYFKYKTDHKGRFTDQTKLKRQKKIVQYMDLKKFNFIKNNDADFASFFLKFYRLPYNNWSHLSHSDFDFVIRFEKLGEDFAKVLALLGIEEKRPLPVMNPTSQKAASYLSYYSPKTIKRAKWVYGPFMEKWGYNFPHEWGDASVSWLNKMEFEFCNIFRMFYWEYLRSRVKNVL